MNFLIDTHAFLFSAFSPEKLGPSAKSAISNSENDISLSVVSLWEISLKFAIGKLDIGPISPDAFPEIAQQMGIDIIPLAPSDAAGFHRLPLTGHRDPFDRMIIWQALQRKWALISKDAQMARYREMGLRTCW
jgi:PIN domain nuclease of toxin-antitoxin system